MLQQDVQHQRQQQIGVVEWQVAVGWAAGEQEAYSTLIASKWTRVCHWLRGNKDRVTNSGSRGCGAPVPRTQTHVDRQQKNPDNYKKSALELRHQ